MKMRWCLLVSGFSTALVFSGISASSQTVVTFDDLHETGSGSYFSYQYQGYQGLTWNNILCNNAILFTNVLPHEDSLFTNGLSGDYYGMVSASNVVMLGVSLDGVSEIDSPATNFNFLSAHLTGFVNSNLNIEVQGFNGASLFYDQTVVANATNPTLFTFDYLNIDRLVFSGSGGEPAFVPTEEDSGFIMDNFTFEFIPEPSSLLLTSLGLATLWAVAKRRRK
jgi:hypothetical protein